MVRAALVLIAALATAPVLAQEEQPYDGAVPGAPAKEKARRKGPNLVTWVGFQKLDGGPRVFLRLSNAPTGNLEQTTKTGELVVKVPGVKIDTKNNTRPLDTRYFGTDIVRVWAAPTKGGVAVHVKFKKDSAQAKISGAATGDPDGSVYVYLDF
jgi:hypothetical protein